jgi:hypothetical protein
MKRARHSATKRPHHTHLPGSKRSSNNLGYPHTEEGRRAVNAVCGG